jgi:diguanylate cyclase (GGDEF)-like protein
VSRSDRARGVAAGLALALLFAGALHGQPAPSDPLAQEAQRLLDARELARAGRFDEAIAVAERLASASLDPARRIQAGVLVVELRAGTRQFTEGQGRLERLFDEVESQGDPALRRQVELAAARFYNELSQQEPAQRHAEAVLAAGPDPAERCAATAALLEARLLGNGAGLSEAGFTDAAALCDAAGEPRARGLVDVAEARWLVRESRADEAAALLAARLPALAATGDLPLRAAAHAYLADALQRSGRADDAAREADAALALSASLPSGLPLLVARRARYAVALERGDTAGALRELQAVITAERAYAEEVRRLQEAYLAGRADAVQRAQTTALLSERNARLDLEATRAERSASQARLLLLPLAVGLLALIAWGWRSRVRQDALRRMLRVDSLTALDTRPYFYERAIAALAEAERSARPMALLLIDLDHFSQVNSRFGHLTGDRLLQAIGRSLQAMQGAGRHFGRLGGEEFALLIPGAGLDEGLAFAERCREAIASTAVETLDGGATVQVTASFGVVSTTAAGYRLRDLLANADHALYRAKNAGRNRVSAAVVVPVAAA